MGSALKSLTKEEELLVLAARVELDHGEAGRLDGILQESPDWTKTMAYSARMGIRPLLHRHLSCGKRARYVPVEINALLAEDYRVQTLRNIRIYGTLRRVLDLANRATIPVILLKGAFLAQWVYPDIALRPMRDIDVLCRMEDHEALQRCLIEKGFTAGVSLEAAYQSPFHAEVYAAHGSHLPPVYDQRITRIEVHSWPFHQIRPAGAKDMQDLWAKSVCHQWDGLEFGSLSPEYQVIHLCGHLHRHMETCSVGLHWFCDIREAIRHYGSTLNWEALYRTADDLGVSPGVKAMLLILINHWDMDIPKPAGPYRRLDLAGVFRVQLSPSDQARCAVWRRYCRRLEIGARMVGWKNRLYFFWKLLFPSAAHIKYRHQPTSAFSLILWRAFHPFFLVGRVIDSLYCHAIHHARNVVASMRIRRCR